MIDIRMKEEDGDVFINNSGSLEWTEPTHQHQYDLLLAAQGHYRETPETGVGSVNYMHENDHSYFLRAVRKVFSKDGMRVSRIEYEQDNLIIEAEYENSNG